MEGTTVSEADVYAKALLDDIVRIADLLSSGRASEVEAILHQDGAIVELRDTKTGRYAGAIAVPLNYVLVMYKDAVGYYSSTPSNHWLRTHHPDTQKILTDFNKVRKYFERISTQQKVTV